MVMKFSKEIKRKMEKLMGEYKKAGYDGDPYLAGYIDGLRWVLNLKPIKWEEE